MGTPAREPNISSYWLCGPLGIWGSRWGHGHVNFTIHLLLTFSLTTLCSYKQPGAGTCTININTCNRYIGAIHIHINSCSANLKACPFDIGSSGGDEEKGRDSERTCNYLIIWKSSHKFCRAGPTMTKMSSTGGPMMMIEGDPWVTLYLCNWCAWLFFLLLFVPMSKSMYEREKTDYRLIVNAAGTDSCRIVHL